MFLISCQKKMSLILFLILIDVILSSNEVCLSGNPPINAFMLGEYKYVGNLNGKPGYYINNEKYTSCDSKELYLYWWEIGYFISDYYSKSHETVRKIRLICTENVTNPEYCDIWGEFHNPPRHPTPYPSVSLTTGHCPKTLCNEINFKWKPSINPNVCAGNYVYDDSIGYDNVYVRHNVSYSPTNKLYIHFNRKLNGWYCGSDINDITACTVRYYADQLKSNNNLWFTNRIINETIDLRFHYYTKNNGNTDKETGNVQLTCIGTRSPTMAPTKITDLPTNIPTVNTIYPTNIPSQITINPTILTHFPTQYTNTPTIFTDIPTIITNNPTTITNNPTKDTIYPTNNPSGTTINPTQSTYIPSGYTPNPTIPPTMKPTLSPVLHPTNYPSTPPTSSNPSITPSLNPSNTPSKTPTNIPSIPTYIPSKNTQYPTEMSSYPTTSPQTPFPSLSPTQPPTQNPTNTFWLELLKNGAHNNGGFWNIIPLYIKILIIGVPLLIILIIILVVCIVLRQIKRRREFKLKQERIQVEMALSNEDNALISGDELSGASGGTGIAGANAQ